MGGLPGRSRCRLARPPTGCRGACQVSGASSRGGHRRHATRLRRREELSAADPWQHGRRPCTFGPGPIGVKTPAERPQGFRRFFEPAARRSRRPGPRPRSQPLACVRADHCSARPQLKPGHVAPSASAVILSASCSTAQHHLPGLARPDSVTVHAIRIGALKRPLKAVRTRLGLARTHRWCSTLVIAADLTASARLGTDTPGCHWGPGTEPQPDAWSPVTSCRWWMGSCMK